MERLMFADLCRFRPGELDSFMFVYVALALALAVATHFVETRITGQSGPKASFAFLVAVGLVPLTWVATTLIFPDPRAHGDDCGFTPDAIFLPIYATITVFVSFLGGRGLMLGVDRYWTQRK